MEHNDLLNALKNLDKVTKRTINRIESDKFDFEIDTPNVTDEMDRVIDSMEDAERRIYGPDGY